MKNKILVTILMSILSVACTVEKPFCKFQDGEKVRSVISQQIGQVVRADNWTNQLFCTYNVRFANVQYTTNTSLLGADGTIEQSPLMLVKYMRHYELEKME